MIPAKRILKLACLVAAVACAQAVSLYHTFDFIQPCSRKDPELESCLARGVNTLAEHYQKGMPELGIEEVEPIILDELHITLGGGPNGYKAQFKNITARGVSSVRVTGLRAEIGDKQVELQLTLSIPKIHAEAKYRSSGTLILVQASGAGDYWGEYEGVKAKVYIRAKIYNLEGERNLALEQLKMDFSVRDIKMGVENVHGGNTILQAALNLFINSNSQELLKEMKPDLRRKLVQVMSTFVGKLFNTVPYDAFMTD